MGRRRNPWLNLGMDSLWLGAEAQGVIALRMMKFAAGGPAAAAEAELMVAEKLRAAAETQTQLLTSVLTGKGHLAPARAVAGYRRKVRANRRRLGKI
ncbi:hypothetical protein [Phenylobacterium sp.]|jgi:hypothetical protein|uniref:hypothetical protein n=1 Tax=Phenylobacterium sp. TaxID=1871053 RepID=UPI002E342C9C|nr:hypothetical protein [Phenylobacterium sp.]HEX4712243.1 hypothetical protein [Phenylobacterium sp.]